MVHLHFRLPDESGDALFWTISQWYWRSRGHNSIKPRSGLMDSWYLINSKKNCCWSIISLWSYCAFIWTRKTERNLLSKITGLSFLRIAVQDILYFWICFPHFKWKKTTAKRAVLIEFPSQMEDAHCFTSLKLIQYEGTAHLIEVSCTKYLSNYDSQSEKRYK